MSEAHLLLSYNHSGRVIMSAFIPVGRFASVIIFEKLSYIVWSIVSQHKRIFYQYGSI